jgi:hypothetical protein
VQDRVINQQDSVSEKIKINKYYSKGLKTYLLRNPNIIEAVKEDIYFKNDMKNLGNGIEFNSKTEEIKNFYLRNPDCKENNRSNEYLRHKIKGIIKRKKYEEHRILVSPGKYTSSLNCETEKRGRNGKFKK